MKDAAGPIANCDFYPIHISTLPTVNGHQLSPHELLEYFRTHINTYIDPNLGVSFNAYDYNGINDSYLWSQPGLGSLGALVHLDIPINSGTVIESGYENTFNSNGEIYHHFTFSTMHTEHDGYHPVSGNRRFGIYKDNNIGGYTFFISGVDRISINSLVTGDDFAKVFGNQGIYESGAELWRNVQQRFMDFINQVGNSGNANLYSISARIEARPPWLYLEKWLRKEISTVEFRQSLGC